MPQTSDTVYYKFKENQMRFHQLKEIYEHVMEINQALNDLYAYFLENTKDERTRIFIHYVIEKQTENILDIKRLISDDNYRDEIIRKGLVNSQKYEPKKIANEYVKLYMNLSKLK